MNNQSLLSALIALIIGLGIGYALNPGCTMDMKSQNQTSGMMMNHTMHMDDMMKSMTMNLEGKKNAEFDKAFIDEMIPHHQGAVVMAEMVLKQTDRKELQDLARAIIEAQNKEIKQMSDWRAAWFK